MKKIKYTALISLLISFCFLVSILFSAKPLLPFLVAALILSNIYLNYLLNKEGDWTLFMSLYVIVLIVLIVIPMNSLIIKISIFILYFLSYYLSIIKRISQKENE